MALWPITVQKAAACLIISVGITPLLKLRPTSLPEALGQTSEQGLMGEDSLQTCV